MRQDFYAANITQDMYQSSQSEKYRLVDCITFYYLIPLT